MLEAMLLSIDLEHESALNIEAGLRQGVQENIRYNVACFTEEVLTSTG